MSCGVAAGDVEGDDIDLAEELVEVADQFDSAVEHAGGADEGVEADDGHLHRQSSRGDGSADSTHSDDAEGFAGELSALKLASLFPIELAGLEAGVGLGDFSGQAH